MTDGLVDGDKIRKIPIFVFIAFVLGYLGIVLAMPLLTTEDGIEYGAFPTTESIVRGSMLPVVAAVLFTVLVISVLGWWRPILRDHRPVQRWLWAIPIVMGVTILIVTDYGNLSDLGGKFTLTLLASSLLVGLGEELMFRGLGVTVFRVNQFPEIKVALWSSLIFGSAHLINIVLEGPKAILQVVIVSFSGYILYIVRRVSGGILLPIIMHGLWDFSLFSAQAGPDPELYPIGLLAAVGTVAMLIVLWARHSRIELDPQPWNDPVSV